MRLKVGILTICVLSLAACGPGPKPARNGQTDLVTHGTPENDAQSLAPSPYSDNGDSRVTEFLRQTPPPKPQPTPTPNTPPEQKTLAKKIKEFQITRYSQDRDKPQQLGTYRAEIVVFFVGADPVTFRGPFKSEGKKLKFEESANGMTFKGELEDFDGESKGEFTLSQGQESAHIFYRALKSRLQVRTDSEKAVVQGSQIDQYIQALKNNEVYGWNHNWVVIEQGTIVNSTFLMDIVNNGPIQLSLKGESKHTDDGEQPITIDVPKPKTDKPDNKPQPKVEAQLIGNAKHENHRLIAVQVQEKPNDEPEEFLLEVAAEKPQPPPKPAPEDTPQEWPSANQAFMRVDLGSPRSSKMAQDFEKNRGLPGVDAKIAYFQRKGGRTDLENFYRCSSAFRPLIEAVGQAYDVSPAFAYLTVVESVYFTGCNYQIQPAESSTAVGPFQILFRTATETLKMKVNSEVDERRFFKPSACAAAKYVGMNVDLFAKRDSTLGILAYFQGDGGAAAAIYCALGPDAGKACASRINRKDGYSRADYGRFKKLIRNYNFSYREMEALSMIRKDMSDYVNKKLAVYFISNDMARYGFAHPGPPPAKFPDKALTTITPGTVRDPVCNSIQ